MRLVLVTLAFIALACQSAQAETAFWLERGNWWVGNNADRCVAGSRPSIETNISPFMSLKLLYENDRREIFVEANFWPDAFEKGQKTTMSLFRRGDVDVSLPATASNHYAIVSDRSLTRDESRILKNEMVLAVRAEGVPFSLGVQMIPSFGTIESDLKACARLVGGE